MLSCSISKRLPVPVQVSKNRSWLGHFRRDPWLNKRAAGGGFGSSSSPRFLLSVAILLQLLPTSKRQQQLLLLTVYSSLSPLSIINEDLGVAATSAGCISSNACTD